MFVLKNNQPYEYPQALYAGKNIMIGVDSSKSNSGITIGDCNRNIIDVFDINGASDGTTEYDTLELCFRQRKFLSTIFEGSNIRAVGIENIITKDKTEVLNTHLSRFKITAVFMSFISYFQDVHNITADLINNQSWKAGVLPEKYRTKEYRKGSLAYFKDIHSKYGQYSDDATDSICIYQYLCDTKGVKRGFAVESKEVPRKDFIYGLYGSDWYKKLTDNNAVVYLYNNHLSLKDNAIYMGNRLGDKVGMSVVDTSCLSFEEIYSKCEGTFKEKEKELVLAVWK